MKFDEAYMSLKQRELRLFEFIIAGKAIEVSTIEIAHKLKFSIRTVFTHLNTLEDLGLIVRLSGVSGECNQYIVPDVVRQGYDMFIDDALQFVGLR